MICPRFYFLLPVFIPLKLFEKESCRNLHKAVQLMESMSSGRLLKIRVVDPITNSVFKKSSLISIDH